MSFAVVKPVIQLRETYRRFMWIALTGGLLAAGLSSLLFYPSYSTQRAVLLGPLLLVYVLRKGYLWQRGRQAVRQLRLEEQFLRQGLEPAQLRQCLYGYDHLWSRSLTLQGLQSILDNPLPRLLRPQEKKKRIRTQYHRVLLPLRLPAFNLDLTLCLLFFGTWLFLVGPQNLSLLSAAAPLLMLTVEGLQAVFQRRLHAAFDHAEQSLCHWTLAHRFDEMLSTMRNQLYIHRSLYQVRPWFTTGPSPADMKKRRHPS